VKAVAINALYGTNVLAIARVAEHIVEVLGRTDIAAASPALVEELAAVPQGGGEKRPRRRHSFASKFAHFFIEPVRFPIFDRYAADMVRLHLGQARAIQDPERPYFAFVANVEALERAIGYRGSRRELDRYLWIAGLYRRWSGDPRASINGELRRLFEIDGEELGVLAACP
jgi:hypothetical protein